MSRPTWLSSWASATAALSAAVTESKEPGEACATTDVGMHSNDTVEFTGKIPSGGIAGHNFLGSFGCSVVRFANHNFAQDDRALYRMQYLLPYNCFH
jgi:hypothetical protein